MRTVGKRSLWCGAIVAAMVIAKAAAHAQASPDEPAAVLVYPFVIVDPATGADTLIQLTNTSDAPVELRCFYEDFTPQCSTGEAAESCTSWAAVKCTGLCMPHRTVLPVRLRATPQQPLAWYASAGLQNLPLDGVDHSGPLGANNQFSSVPGVGPGPFTGTLRCIALSADPYLPLKDNILVGQAAIEHSQGTPVPYTDAAQYRAVGVKALSTGPNHDEFLSLGGPGGEYEGCAGVGLLEHFFDGASLQTGDVITDVSTTLVLANCSVLPSGMTDNIVEFVVFNEFAQRLSTSRSLRGQLATLLTGIDGSTPDRSIFFFGVSGTLTGRTIVRGVNGGVHLVAIESHSSRSTPGVVHSDAINAPGLGTRPDGDVVTYRPPRCIGDCNFDGMVTVNEVIQGVNIGLGTLAVASCVPVDANLDSEVTVNELVSSVSAALDGCPDPLPPPTPAVTSSPTLTDFPPPQSAGPQITHLGVATADDRPLQPDSVDAMGRSVFVRPFGQGMTLVIEARPGQSGRAAGRTTYSQAGELPDLQVLVSRPLGDGGATVCENNGRTGGIPAVATLDFTPAAETVAAINDLGCRAFDMGSPPPSACTRTADFFGTVNSASTLQFCIPIAKAWAFPIGDTVVAARVRDQAGNIGPVQEIIVRVLE